jgi:S1-C subfamily serine protease
MSVLEDQRVDECVETDPLDAYSRVVTHVAHVVTPSVASLRVRRHGRVAGSGSGVVVTPDGFLLSSAHVGDGHEGGEAGFADGRELDFDVVGRDPLSDLAVVHAHVPPTGDPLTPAVLGDAARLQVGQLVVAVGNPLGFDGSLSAGVVSGLGRSMVARGGSSAHLVENVIQTDAALHPGNSGGALANGRAEVVGVNTAVVGPGSGQGLGLAVPIDATTRGIVAALLRDGRVRRAYLGIAGGARPLPPRASRVTERARGLEVTTVVAGSPAARAGIRPEDVILDVDGVAVVGVGELQRLMTGDRIGHLVPVRVYRDGGVIDVRVTPAELGD